MPLEEADLSDWPEIERELQERIEFPERGLSIRTLKKIRDSLAPLVDSMVEGIGPIQGMLMFFELMENEQISSKDIDSARMVLLFVLLDSEIERREANIPMILGDAFRRAFVMIMREDAERKARWAKHDPRNPTSEVKPLKPPAKKP